MISFHFQTAEFSDCILHGPNCKFVLNAMVSLFYFSFAVLALKKKSKLTVGGLNQRGIKSRPNWSLAICLRNFFFSNSYPGKSQKLYFSLYGLKSFPFQNVQWPFGLHFGLFLLLKVTSWPVVVPYWLWSGWLGLLDNIQNLNVRLGIKTKVNTTLTTLNLFYKQRFISNDFLTSLFLKKK